MKLYCSFGSGSCLGDALNLNSSGSIVPIVVQADGKILVGGSFSNIGGQPRNSIARLNPDLTMDANINPDANGSVYTIAVQADGKVLVGGVFTSIGGQPRNHIARLDATTGAPDSFNPSANKDVWSIALQTDGKILVGGDFSGSNSIGGETRNFMARLDPNTGSADAFNPNASGSSTNPLLGSIYSISLQADGRILAGGFFNQIGGQPRNCIARLYATSALADSFNPNASRSVQSVTAQADGKILAGGYFSAIGEQTRQSFARLSNDTAAQQNIAVTQTSVIWTRGGSSPQFARVTFESSTTLGGYSPLGQGTASGDNWCLTGLNLPTGQNLNIRARGYYCSGFANGSQSIQESVKNVFLTPLPARITSIARLAGGSIELRGVGTSNVTHPLEASPDLTPLSFMSIGNVTPDAFGNWLFLDTGASGKPRRFYRLAFP